MEKTIDEILFEKLREVRKMSRPHPPVMPFGPEDMPPHGMGFPPMRDPGSEDMPRPERGGHCGMKGPEGMPHHGKGPRGMRHHGFLHRERVLTVLLENEKGMHQKDILQEMHIHPSSLSELIDKLESDRYVERTVDPDDRRATLITLTEKGRARAYEVSDQRKAHVSEIFSVLSDEEKQQLLVILDKILSAKK